ncbi:923_t:CDS:1, partial [Paraglomus brasilianum]
MIRAMVASASQATFTALTQAMAIDEPELQQICQSMVNPEQRLFTPPPIEVREKETPTKGRKQMAKDDDAWTPTDGEILTFVIDNRICTSCWCAGHAFTCAKKSLANGVLATKKSLSLKDLDLSLLLGKKKEGSRNQLDQMQNWEQSSFPSTATSVSAQNMMRTT